MPAKPRWHAQLEPIRRTLASLPSPYLDRPAIEKLFGVKSRQANYLMRSLGGYRIGQASVVSREELLGKLDALSGLRGYLSQAQRKTRVVEALDELRGTGRPRPIATPPPRPAGASLPDGARLTAPGQLTIAFATPEELLGCLMALAQSAAGDYAGFAAGLSGAEPE
jgi:hypothetical protein